MAAFAAWLCRHASNGKRVCDRPRVKPCKGSLYKLLHVWPTARMLRMMRRTQGQASPCRQKTGKHLVIRHLDRAVHQAHAHSPKPEHLQEEGSINRKHKRSHTQERGPAHSCGSRQQAAARAALSTALVGLVAPGHVIDTLFVAPASAQGCCPPVLRPQASLGPSPWLACWSQSMEQT